MSANCSSLGPSCAWHMPTHSAIVFVDCHVIDCSLQCLYSFEPVGASFCRPGLAWPARLDLPCVQYDEARTSTSKHQRNGTGYLANLISSSYLILGIMLDHEQNVCPPLSRDYRRTNDTHSYRFCKMALSLISYMPISNLWLMIIILHNYLEPRD